MSQLLPTFGKLQSTQPQFRRTDFTPQPFNPQAQPAHAAAQPAYAAPPSVSQYAGVLGEGFTSGGDVGDGGVVDVSRAVPVKGLRFAAGFIDLIIMVVALFGLSIAVGIVLGASAGVSGREDSPIIPLLIINFVIAPLCCFAYGVIMDASKHQGTVGKIATGTIVTDKAGKRLTLGHSFGRNLLKIVSGLVPFYIPYIMVFTTQKNQTMHDMICGTLVFNRSDRRASTAVFD